MTCRECHEVQIHGAGDVVLCPRHAMVDELAEALEFMLSCQGLLSNGCDHEKRGIDALARYRAAKEGK
jgi:hypothetical protein